VIKASLWKVDLYPFLVSFDKQTFNSMLPPVVDASIVAKRNNYDLKRIGIFLYCQAFFEWDCN
jgi:hypothetical protein